MQNGIRRRNGGFTLIELLVVIGIIVILVGILLPVVSTMHKKAQQTDSAAMITRLATSIHNYYQDYRAFPGPIADTMVYGGNGGTSNSVTGVTGLTTISSSQNLVLGLLGGIQPPSSATSPTLTYNVALVGKGPQSLNYMSPQQVTPYYDATSAELANNGSGTPQSYVTNQPLLSWSGLSAVPELMDHFSNPHPILYVRAMVGGNSICDQPRSSSSPGSQYFTNEFLPYWIVWAGITNFTGAASPKATATPTTGAFSTPDANGNKLYLSAYFFFMNPTINDNITPRSKDSFILISAGYDGIYGTADDIVYSN